jgi:Flp pilus assembly protein TadD
VEGYHAFMKSVLAIVVLVLAGFVSSQAQSPDDQYLRIYGLMQEADTISSTGNPADALAKYTEAKTQLERLKQGFPDWSPRVVSFRLNYLEGRISTLSSKVPQSTTTPVLATTRAVSPETARELDTVKGRVAGLENEVRQLLADKVLLEAKLKEAFTVQPAATDPRELAKAQERAQELLKENELLKASAMAATQKVGEPVLDTEKLLRETKESLADANRKLAGETVRADKAAQERAALESRLKTITSDAETAAALRAENEILKKQLGEIKASELAKASQENEIKQMQSRIASLQSDAETLRVENQGLQSRLKEVPASRERDASRIQQLEKERDDLRKELAKTEKGGWFRRRSKGSDEKLDQLTSQMETYRARIEILEAKAVPYTAEELALFQKPPTTLAAAPETKNTTRAASAPPSGTKEMVAEAQRFFATKQYDKAEQRYRDILRRDESNVYTLANLAAIQLEMGRLDEAETNVKKALSTSPSDAYSLSILGYLKFRQEKFDEAIDALSRAAQFEPDNAEIQNYLGVSLGHKGLRVPAETALRKAIQLQPNYGNAHNNLAVIYATQQPPMKELARWHYQKARSAGHARNDELEKLLEQSASPNAAPVAP